MRALRARRGLALPALRGRPALRQPRVIEPRVRCHVQVPGNNGRGDADASEGRRGARAERSEP
eukprot:13383265-Alexandrium_andersonii.AAC.1